MNLLVRDGRLEDGSIVDVRIASGRIVAVGARRELAAADGDEDVLDAAGAAVLPGLHDHHVHLRAMAAAVSSVRAGPPSVRTSAQLAAALRGADGDRPAGEWLRAVGYHESVAGDLDRAVLDRLVRDRPVRVQHRSGALWIVNSAAADRLGLATRRSSGIERGSDGEPTGRLWRADAWLQGLVPPVRLDWSAVSTAGAARGVTGYTDADPARTPDDVHELRRLRARGDILQRLRLMGPAPTLRSQRGDGDGMVTAGEVKVLLDDDRLPTVGELEAAFAEAHRHGLRVAVHCVTRVQLVATVTALRAAGPVEGDRIEHGSVIPFELLGDLAELGVSVVTQPNFVAERGDRYLEEVDAGDVPSLYRLQSLLDAGVRLAAGTDAPFGDADPWAAVRAAVDRTSAEGRVLGADERIGARRALGLFLGRADAPATERRIAPGEPGDLCVLTTGLAEALADPLSVTVAATVVAGRVVFSSTTR